MIEKGVPKAGQGLLFYAAALKKDINHVKALLFPFF
jgi:hypothetical protein